MRGRKGLGMFLFSVLLGCPITSFGFDMSVTIEGTELSTVQTATVGSDTVHYINIAGISYQNGCAIYKIEPNTTTGSSPANLARVEAIDSTTDTLWLRNAKITATTDCVDNAHIYFWGNFAGGPNTGADTTKPKVNIQRNANGLFTPATTGNWITISSSVQNPVNPDPPDGVSGEWQEIGSIDSHVVTPQTGGVFSKTRNKTWDPAQGQTMTGFRIMKGDIQFKLENNGNKLVFDNSSGKGIKIYSKTSAAEIP